MILNAVMLFVAVVWLFHSTVVFSLSGEAIGLNIAAFVFPIAMLVWASRRLYKQLKLNSERPGLTTAFAISLAWTVQHIPGASDPKYRGHGGAVILLLFFSLVTAVLFYLTNRKKSAQSPQNRLGEK